MIGYDAGTTSPTLLNRLGDWQDHQAWLDFVTRYDPAIRACCLRYRFDAAATDELCQRVRIDLARRMLSFRYDPGKSFRHWLGQLCHWRARDLLRKQKLDIWLSLEDGAETFRQADDTDADETEEEEHASLLQLAEDVQTAVRRRVDERTWRVFWSIAVSGQSVRETSDAEGMTYYAAFAAQKRVGRMLREEGERLRGELAPRDRG